MNDKVVDYLGTNLGKYFNRNEIDYNEVNTEQYEILCGRFGLNSYSKQTMLVLYFDISKNAIDWYDLFKESTDFWYDPMYYMQSILISEAVFIKYLKGAEKVADWGTLLVACEVRFSGDKKKCQNEQILKMWTQATEKQGESHYY